MKKIILASASPRRHELLNLLTIQHEVIPCNEDEQKITNFNNKKFDDGDVHKHGYHEKQVINVAYQKANCVARLLPEKEKKDSLIIGADTIVVLEDEIIGKPKTTQEAIQMLEELTGNVHLVYTGLCVLEPETNHVLTGVEITEVSMIECSKEEIESYVKAEYVLDKAGGYAIQGIGAFMIDYVKGCFYNVMGLPLSKLVTMLKKMGFELFK
ncbi:MAG: septum formation protein Maf [Asgard group archaeon]|nr:septum formation protein Maf [Asgard group archaeon]